VAVYVQWDLEGPLIGAGLDRPELFLALARALPADQMAADGDTVVWGLFDGTRCIGFLSASNLSNELIRSNMLASVARQLSDGLINVLAAESLRRQAATGRLSALLATFDEGYTEAGLAEVVREMSYLEGVAGVELRLESPYLGGAVRITSGSPVLKPVLHCQDVLDGGIPFEVLLGGTAHSTAAQNSSHLAVIDQLRGVLSKVEKTRRLRIEAETDPLTGVGNRRRADRALEVAMGRADRTAQSLAVLLIDLDHFKRVNDRFGHAVGDTLLTVVAAGIAESMRPADTVARMGGEEFLVICPGTDRQAASSVAGRLLSLVPELSQPAIPAPWHQTISVGVATYPADAANVEHLLLRADEALYDSKRGGRNQWSTVQRGAGVGTKA
jgi:diguanylate cyclase (GGDEF)-like protein